MSHFCAGKLVAPGGISFQSFFSIMSLLVSPYYAECLLVERKKLSWHFRVLFKSFNIIPTAYHVFVGTAVKFFWVLHESGALQDVLHLHDVLARVSLARLCHTISIARSLDGKCIGQSLLAFIEML